jgi:hypothetical protein
VNRPFLRTGYPLIEATHTDPAISIPQQEMRPRLAPAMASRPVRRIERNDR